MRRLDLRKDKIIEHQEEKSRHDEDRCGLYQLMRIAESPGKKIKHKKIETIANGVSHPIAKQAGPRLPVVRESPSVITEEPQCGPDGIEE